MVNYGTYIISNNNLLPPDYNIDEVNIDTDTNINEPPSYNEIDTSDNERIEYLENNNIKIDDVNLCINGVKLYSYYIKIKKLTRYMFNLNLLAVIIFPFIYLENNKFIKYNNNTHLNINSHNNITTNLNNKNLNISINILIIGNILLNLFYSILFNYKLLFEYIFDNFIQERNKFITVHNILISLIFLNYISSLILLGYIKLNIFMNFIIIYLFVSLLININFYIRIYMLIIKLLLP